MTIDTGQGRRAFPKVEGRATQVRVGGGEVCGQSAVEILIRIGGKDDRVDEIAVGRDVIAREDRPAQQTIKGRVEGQKIPAISTPVEWLFVEQAAEGLRHHGALHRMHFMHEAGGDDRLHGLCWIPQVPGDVVPVCVHVARGAGGGAAARQPGVVKESRGRCG